MTDIDWQHIGVATKLVSDAGGRHVELRVGPFGVSVYADPSGYQLRREQRGEEDADPRIFTRTAGGQVVHGWLSRYEFGASVRTARLADGLHVRGLVGPFGFAVEPAKDATP
jgi:hypothetical protein